MKADATYTATCPLCGTAYSGHPAISRTDNKTPICPDCGTREALQSLGISTEEQNEILDTIHRSQDSSRSLMSNFI